MRLLLDKIMLSCKSIRLSKCFCEANIYRHNWIKNRDQNRLVHYEGDATAETGDMFSYMYPSLDKLLDSATAAGEDFTKPVVLCEYGHAMGNGPGALKEYHDMFIKYRRLQGGWVWEWANHGLWKEANDGKEGFYAYGGAFGEQVHDGSFVMDGIVYSDHRTARGLIELKKVIEPVKISMINEQLVVRNELDFETLDHLQFNWGIETLSRRQV